MRFPFKLWKIAACTTDPDSSLPKKILALEGLPRKILIARENTCLWKDCLFTKFSLTCSCICFWVRPLYLKYHFCVSGLRI